jgi:FkbM family methyltransferase
MRFNLTSTDHQVECDPGLPHDPHPGPNWLNLVAKLIRHMPVGRYSLISWLRRGPQKTFLVSTPRVLGGDTLQFSFRDPIGRQVFLGGCYEPQESACVRDILRPGMTFVDVGANWGFFTQMAAHLVGSSGRVVAIEADPRVFVRLKQNVARNHLKHVQVFDIAVADRNGELTLAGHDEAEGNPGISRLIEIGSPQPLTFSVQSRRLDSLLDEAGLDHVDLVKIDVEGAEDLVLTGMDEGLISHRYRSIVLEIHPLQLSERGHTTSEILDVLKGRGYRGYVLDYSKALRKAYYKPWLHSSEFLLPLERVEMTALQCVQPNETHLHTIWISRNHLHLLEFRP